MKVCSFEKINVAVNLILGIIVTQLCFSNLGNAQESDSNAAITAATTIDYKKYNSPRAVMDEVRKSGFLGSIKVDDKGIEESFRFKIEGKSFIVKVADLLFTGIGLGLLDIGFKNNDFAGKFQGGLYLSVGLGELLFHKVKPNVIVGRYDSSGKMINSLAIVGVKKRSQSEEIGNLMLNEISVNTELAFNTLEFDMTYTENFEKIKEDIGKDLQNDTKLSCIEGDNASMLISKIKVTEQGGTSNPDPDLKYEIREIHATGLDCYTLVRKADRKSKDFCFIYPKDEEKKLIYNVLDIIPQQKKDAQGTKQNDKVVGQMKFSQLLLNDDPEYTINIPPTANCCP